MNAQQLIGFFEKQGIALTLRNGRIAYRAHKGAVPSEIVDLLRCWMITIALALTTISLQDFEQCGWEEGKSEATSYLSWCNFFATRGADATRAGHLEKARMLWLLADACWLRLDATLASEPLQQARQTDHPSAGLSHQECIERLVA